MRVRITLDQGQSHDDGEEQLFKALEAHREGLPHDQDTFVDPAMEHQAQIIKAEYAVIFDAMMQEILDVLDEEGSSW